MANLLIHERIWLVIIAGFETKRPLEQALAQKRREIHDIQGGCKIGLADVGWHYNSGGGGVRYTRNLEGGIRDEITMSGSGICYVL